MNHTVLAFPLLLVLWGSAFGAEETGHPKPYAPPCVERENLFEFSAQPEVSNLGEDRYEIRFATRGLCDVTVGIVDPQGKVVRHLACGVLGAHAPVPFLKNSLSQRIYWDGKDDLGGYVREPETLRVRVMLGLKPEFEKRLGGVSPYNLPGYVWGLALTEEAAHVFALGHHIALRKFDRDGRYLRSLLPPPPDLPQEKLEGLTFAEYEKGQRAVHGPEVQVTTAGYADWIAGAAGHGLTPDCQPGVIDGRLYYATSGSKAPSRIHWIHTDGSTDAQGVAGRELGWPPHLFPRLAATPDGKSLLLAGFGGDRGRDSIGHFVARVPVSGESKPEVFLGDGKPGSAEGKFNGANGLDCDAQGRIYVTDYYNSRLQVFAADGKFLRSFSVDRPYLVRVHRKSGALYVFHHRREQGQTLACMSKYASWEQTSPEFRVNDLQATAAALDHWSPKTRLWTGGHRSEFSAGALYRTVGGGPSVRIWEEDGKGMRLLLDFDEQARKEDGANHLGRWSGSGWGGSGFGPGTGKLCADPTREVLFLGTQAFDLVSGAPLGELRINCDSYEDIAADKRGYLHVHFNPGFYGQGVGRVNLAPGPAKLQERGRETVKVLYCNEVPYDYGEEFRDGRTWRGVLPVKDQPGAKFFQDGLGANMGGHVAVLSNIYYAPKFDEYTQTAWGVGHQKRDSTYPAFLRSVREMEQKGEALYSLRRRPGIPLAGGTIWTFEQTGELQLECAVTAGDLLNGAQIDQEGCVYTVTARPRIFDPAQGFFLAGRGGRHGVPKGKGENPFTGTLIKTKPLSPCQVLLAEAPVPMDRLPSRPPDLMATDWPHAYSKASWAWVEGAEWLYAGASPIVSVGCSCSTQRLHLDWYGRAYVPEAYRHSFGVLDTAGNLILHLGRYGNFDSASGPQSRIPVGGDGIGITMPRFISGTDNFLAFSDWGERLVVLGLRYHAEATVAIGSR